MIGDHFYFTTTRKVITILGSLFSGLSIIRTGNNTEEEIPLPVSYAPKFKYLYKLTQLGTDEEATLSDVETTDLQEILPRMTYYMTSMQYDSRRKLPTTNKNVSGDSSLKQFSPVPYNLGFELSILTKYTDDMYQVVEQILPWFTPDLTIPWISVPEIQHKDKLVISLNDVSIQDNFDDNFDVKRNVIGTLNFTVKTNYYPPITDAKIIKTAIVDFYDSTPIDPFTGEFLFEEAQSIPRVFRITVSGTGTSNDDPGTVTTVNETFTDGKRRDPLTGNDVNIGTQSIYVNGIESMECFDFLHRIL